MNTTSPSSSDPVPATALRHLRRDILAMQGYTPGEQVRDCVKLNTNECAWPPSPAVVDALTHINNDHLRLYPDPVAMKLRQAAASAYALTPDQILVGNGSDDCLTIIYRAFLSPGDRVTAPWPTYGLYDTLATLQGVEMVHVDFRQTGDMWQLPSTLAKQAAKVVLIANPNNPSATLVPVQELRQLAYETDGIVVVDEAYIDFAPDGSSMLPHLDKHANVIVLRTFSKSYSLAGARLGLLFAHPELVQHLMKVKDSYNVNALTQIVGTAAVNDRDHHRDLVRRTLTERDRLEKELRAFGWTWPTSAGNFLLCQVGPQAEVVYRSLKEHGILVRWWNTPALREKLRITVGQPTHTDALLAHLRTIAHLWTSA